MGVEALLIQRVQRVLTSGLVRRGRKEIERDYGKGRRRGGGLGWRPERSSPDVGPLSKTLPTLRRG